MKKFQQLFNILLVLVLTTNIEAQQWNRERIESVISVGTRIRLNSVKVGQFTGFVAAIDDTSLTIFQEDRSPLKVELNSINELEISLGKTSHVIEGLIIGSGIGLILGLVVPVDPNATQKEIESYNGSFARTREEAIGLGLIGGAAWGALIGWLIKSDEWSHIHPETTLPAKLSSVFQATLTWTNNEQHSTDLNLHLYGPNGMHVYWLNPQSADSNFILDHNWLRSYGNAIENIYSARSIPPGDYKVTVHHYSGDPANYNIRILRFGTVRNFAGNIFDNEEIEIMTFKAD
jgi:hypothetical protein